MPLANYEIVTGFNDSAAAVNVETLVSYPPSSPERVPFGAVRHYTLDDYRITDGVKSIVWQWTVLPLADVDTLVTTVWGDWNTENAEVTIRTRNRDNTYSYYNAIAHFPELVYLNDPNEGVIVSINFRIQGAAT